MNIQGLISFAPVFMRCFGLLVLIPLGDSTAVHRRAGLAAGLTFFICGEIPNTGECSIVSLIIEFIIGLFLALPAAVTISLAASFGELFDTQRGQMIGSVYDPLSSEVSSSSSVLFSNLSWAVLCSVGFLETILAAVIRSFSILTPGSGSVTTLSEISLAMFKLLIFTFTGCITTFLPVALLFLLIDSGLALISKSVPHLSLLSEATQIKSALGWVVLSQCYWLLGVDRLVGLASPLLKILVS